MTASSFVYHVGRATVGQQPIDPPQAFGGNESAPAGRKRLKFLSAQDRAIPKQQHVPAIAVKEQTRVISVPEFRFGLDPSCQVSVTIAGHGCQSLIGCCRVSNTHGREVGGLIVGHRWVRSAGEAVTQHDLVVTDAIPIESIDSSNSHLSFGERAWAQVHRELDARFASEGKCSLGWFHTHPTQGIFFSAQDKVAHTIFTGVYQFAMVVDPRTMEAGVFYWSNYPQRALGGPIRLSLNTMQEST